MHSDSTSDGVSQLFSSELADLLKSKLECTDGLVRKCVQTEAENLKLKSELDTLKQRQAVEIPEL